jgi:hypothetical protein
MAIELPLSMNPISLRSRGVPSRMQKWHDAHERKLRDLMR